MRYLRTAVMHSTLGALPFCAAADANLYDTIKQADTTFFNAFNRCDIDTMAAMFSKDLEFYHDTAGLGNYESNMAATRSLCSGNPGLKRTLIEGTLQVFPVKDFGAVELGQHTFCHLENGVEDCGTFGFTHVWKQTQDGWLLHRVVSYGH